MKHEKSTEESTFGTLFTHIIILAKLVYAEFFENYLDNTI